MTDAQLRRLSSKKLASVFAELLSKKDLHGLTSEENALYVRIQRERERRRAVYRAKLEGLS